METPINTETLSKFVAYLKEITSKGKDGELDSVVEYLYKAKTTVEKEEFLVLSKAYLTKYHMLNDFAVTLSLEERIVNVFFCKRPPC